MESSNTVAALSDRGDDLRVTVLTVGRTGSVANDTPPVSHPW